ncbi:MAG TPA: carboxypeptidase-like regulatory domain-containing protein [Gemmatimonadaceae bacterium]|nr:carboxypeptidase-like regulatory domain-containing protein [Gemmatimonadaceae bacterium]
MPIYLRAFAAEQSRRLAEKRARVNARSQQCVSGTGAIVSRPWNRSRRAAQPALLTGRLTAPDGGGIEGARITIHPLRLVSRTSADGSFRFAIPPQLLGTGEPLAVSIHATGYGPRREDVTLEAGDSAQLSATLCRQTIQLSQVAAAPARTRSSSARQS